MQIIRNITFKIWSDNRLRKNVMEQTTSAVYAGDWLLTVTNADHLLSK